MSKEKTWLVTGASQGLGLTTVKHLLSKGQTVIATTRNPELFDESANSHPNLEVVALDLKNEEAVKNAITQIHEKYGHIDILVNNAGFGFIGAIEEAAAQDVYDVMEINVHATLRMIRYTLPYMRKIRSGHIINLSSVSGLVSMPGFGIYNASKFAIEGLTEALYAEVKPMGIKVTLIGPGAFRTNFLAGSMRISQDVIQDYDPTAGNARRYLLNSGKQPGNPQRAAEEIFNVSKQKNPPLRLLLGGDAYSRVTRKIKALEAEFERNKSITLSTGF